LLFCGVNVDVDSLPGWMETIGRSVPLTHGIEAARRVVDGATLAEVRGLVVTEALIGAAYAIAAYILFRFFEAESRRRASLETF
jgi:ABC-2 type transport system permease protein